MIFRYPHGKIEGVMDEPVGVAGTSAASSSDLTDSTKAEEWQTVGRADVSWSNKACGECNSHIHIMFYSYDINT